MSCDCKLPKFIFCFLLAALWAALVNVPFAFAESEQVMLDKVQNLRLQLKNDEALKLADCALKSYPKSVSGLIIRADLLKELGLMKQAAADLDKAYALAPENMNVLQKHCRMLDMTGHLTEALAEYDIILKKSPRDANFWSYRGQAHKRLKRWAEAAHDFEMAIKNQPNLRDLSSWLYEVGNCQFLAGNEQAALKAFEELVKRFPDMSTGYWGKARVFDKMGKSADAEKQRALAKKRDLEMAPHNLF